MPKVRLYAAEWYPVLEIDDGDTFDEYEVPQDLLDRWLRCASEFDAIQREFDDLVGNG
jgi:hypothetical protein